MAETKHTPTPWAAVEAEGIWIERAGRADDDNVICDLVGRVYDRKKQTNLLTDEDRANAAFIVRAVNAHDAMLAALKKANTCASIPDYVQVLIRSAIAKADGR
jgi:hypothetical protein